MASVQICDLMTLEERAAETFTNYRYGEQFVERAKLEAIERWNTRCAPAVPEGYALVPVEPTPEMLDVAVSFALNVSLSGDYNWSAYLRDVWLRMTAAAQQATQ